MRQLLSVATIASVTLLVGCGGVFGTDVRPVVDGGWRASSEFATLFVDLETVEAGLVGEAVVTFDGLDLGPDTVPVIGRQFGRSVHLTFQYANRSDLHFNGMTERGGPDIIGDLTREGDKAVWTMVFTPE